jgi:hypothetical protein
MKNSILLYENLKSNMSYLLEQDLKVVSSFRAKFNVDKKQMNDLKILDFVLWSYGSIKGK